MIALPIECYRAIFNNLRYKYKDLFSCILVNRQWCRIIIPILWSNPKKHYENINLIEMFLLTLNIKEQALLIPFKITLPSQRKLLFEYTSYITSVNNYLYHGVSNWIKHRKYETGYELKNAIYCSLIAMFLRTSQNLKYLKLNEIICSQLIFENLYENTTITSITFDTLNNIFRSKAIDVLIKVLYKNSTLTSLDLSNQIFSWDLRAGSSK
ncbi:hypothetical protein F8M41_024119 [Gigaspora margarita]|uniref:F-box domain-containing protein n=1 Tax=Gigaspora margarita TaxID=4874 RepID=A0A8H4ACA4_GIGMA|nr:hypothetical protein F8M41_024119 [Gigaspora margarita]